MKHVPRSCHRCRGRNAVVVVCVVIAVWHHTHSAAHALHGDSRRRGCTRRVAALRRPRRVAMLQRYLPVAAGIMLPAATFLDTQTAAAPGWLYYTGNSSDIGHVGDDPPETAVAHVPHVPHVGNAPWWHAYVRFELRTRTPRPSPLYGSLPAFITVSGTAGGTILRKSDGNGNGGTHSQVYFKPAFLVVLTLLSSIVGWVGVVALAVRMVEKKIKWMTRITIMAAFGQAFLCAISLATFFTWASSLPTRARYSETAIYCLLAGLTSFLSGLCSAYHHYLNRGQAYSYTLYELSVAQRQLILLAICSIGYICLTGGLYSYLEGWEFDYAIYFMVTTLSTIGFGDFAPNTVRGKIVLPFVALGGISIIAGTIYSIRLVTLEFLTMRLATAYSKLFGTEHTDPEGQFLQQFPHEPANRFHRTNDGEPVLMEGGSSTETVNQSFTHDVSSINDTSSSAAINLTTAINQPRSMRRTGIMETAMNSLPADMFLRRNPKNPFLLDTSSVELPEEETHIPDVKSNETKEHGVVDSRNDTSTLHVDVNDKQFEGIKRLPTSSSDAGRSTRPLSLTLDLIDSSDASAKLPTLKPITKDKGRISITNVCQATTMNDLESVLSSSGLQPLESVEQDLMVDKRIVKLHKARESDNSKLTIAQQLQPNSASSAISTSNTIGALVPPPNSATSEYGRSNVGHPVIDTNSLLPPSNKGSLAPLSASSFQSRISSEFLPSTPALNQTPGYHPHTMRHRQDTMVISRSQNLPSLTIVTGGQIGRNQVLETTRKAFQREVFTASAMIILTLALFGGAFCYLEEWTYFEGFYFAFVALSTIGYGDYSPSSVPGRSFFVWFIFVGMGLIAYFVSILSEIALDKWTMTVNQIGRRVDRYEKKARLKKIYKKTIRDHKHGKSPNIMDSIIQGDIRYSLDNEQSADERNPTFAVNSSASDEDEDDRAPLLKNNSDSRRLSNLRDLPHKTDTTDTDLSTGRQRLTASAGNDRVRSLRRSHHRHFSWTSADQLPRSYGHVIVDLPESYTADQNLGSRGKPTVYSRSRLRSANQNDRERQGNHVGPSNFIIAPSLEHIEQYRHATTNEGNRSHHRRFKSVATERDLVSESSLPNFQHTDSSIAKHVGNSRNARRSVSFAVVGETPNNDKGLHGGDTNNVDFNNRPTSGSSSFYDSPRQVRLGQSAGSNGGGGEVNSAASSYSGAVFSFDTTPRDAFPNNNENPHLNRAGSASSLESGASGNIFPSTGEAHSSSRLDRRQYQGQTNDTNRRSFDTNSATKQRRRSSETVGDTASKPIRIMSGFRTLSIIPRSLNSIGGANSPNSPLSGGSRGHVTDEAGASLSDAGSISQRVQGSFSSSLRSINRLFQFSDSKKGKNNNNQDQSNEDNASSSKRA